MWAHMEKLVASDWWMGWWLLIGREGSHDLTGSDVIQTWWTEVTWFGVGNR